MRPIGRFIAYFVLPFFLAMGGCVTLPLPGIQPLEEIVIGGEGADKVLVIEISGLITDKTEKSVLGFETEPRITSRIREELDKAAEDKRVRAVVLRINSPGGLVTTCDIIHHEIEGFKKRTKKVVVAQMMDVAASGGYYIAVAADKVVAHPTTVTGSVGVVAYRVDASGLLKKIGIVDDTIKSGERKDIGSPLRAMTPEERVILQDVIDSMFERFVEVVRLGRPGMSSVALDVVKDGRVFVASQALKLGLIDRIGYLDDGVNLAKSEAGIKEATIITYARPRSYRANIYSLAGGAPSINVVNIDVGSLARSLGLSFMYLWLP